MEELKGRAGRPKGAKNKPKETSILEFPRSTLENIPDIHSVIPGWDATGVPWNKRRYGVVLVNDEGKILLREPAGHYGGYHWTFAKGGLRNELENPIVAAIRELEEETGHDCKIIGAVPNSFGSTVGTKNYFFIAKDGGKIGEFGKETQALKWLSPDEAEEYIRLSDAAGAQRDLSVLKGFTKEYDMVKIGKSEVVDRLKMATDVRQEFDFIPKSTMIGTFPDDVTSLQDLGSAGGSTGARRYRDPVTGKEYIGKYGRGAEQLRSEVLADSIYEVAGIRVPEFRVYDTPNGPMKLTSVIKGRTLNEFMVEASPAEVAAVKAELAKGFGFDTLLGNWDVIGLEYDNILVDMEGKVWRIDNGGSLLFRAQGQRKALSAFDGNPVELWSMRQRNNIWKLGRSEQWDMFGDMSFTDMIDSMQRVSDNKFRILGLIDDPILRETIRLRIAQFEDIIKIADKMMVQDIFRPSYVDEFLQLTVGMRKAGVSKLIPKEMRVNGVKLIDLMGELWDALRGDKGVAKALLQFGNESGINTDIINRWMSGQSGSSWSDNPMASKYFFYKNIKVARADVIWSRSDYAYAKLQYESIIHGDISKERGLTLIHAFTREMLTTMKIPNVNLTNQTVDIFRAEKKSIAVRYGLNELKMYPADAMKHNLYDSTSIFKIAEGWGDTTYNGHYRYYAVPCHRILTTYFMNMFGSGCALYTEGENEFLAMLYGLPFKRIA